MASPTPSTPQSHPQVPRPALAGASGHNLALDGVRGMAILLVMWHHMTVFHPSNGVERVFEAASELGTTGVDLFFVLSGFLITGILYDSKQAIVASPFRAVGSKNTARKGGATFFGNFYARRTLRIFPLYYAVVAFSLILLPHLAELLRHVVSAEKADLIGTKLNRFENIHGYAKWFWLYLSNVPIAYTGKWLHGILGISWSLAIEEQFYLVWPMLVWFLSRKNAIRVCATLLVVALVCRCQLSWMMISRMGEVYGYGAAPAGAPALPWANPVGVYVLTFCRVDDLSLGALAALLLRGTMSIEHAAGIGKRLVWVCLPAYLALVLVDSGMGWTNRTEGMGFGPLTQTVGYTLAGLACLGALVLAVASRPGGVWHGFWTSWFMRTLGKYAYALYLFHLSIRAMIRDVVFGPAVEAGKVGGPRWVFPRVMGLEFPAQLAFYVLAIGASVGVAWVSWVVFESQILKLKKYFPSGVEGKGK